MQEAISSLKEKWNELSDRERIMAAALGALLIVFILYRFYFQPQYENLTKAKASMQESVTVVQEAKARGLGDVPRLIQALQDTERKVKSLYYRVPGYKDTPGFIVTLYNLAEDHDLYLVANPEDTSKDKDKSGAAEQSGKNSEESKTPGGMLQFGELQQNGAYSSYDVTMVLMGTSQNVYEFIYDLERISRLVSVQTIAFVPVNKGVLSCELSIRVYVLGAGEPDPAPATYGFPNVESAIKEPYAMFQPSVIQPLVGAGKNNASQSSAAGESGGQTGQSEARPQVTINPPDVIGQSGIPPISPITPPPQLYQPD